MSDGRRVPKVGLSHPERRAAFDVNERIKDRVTHLDIYDIFWILKGFDMDEDKTVEKILNDHDPVLAPSISKISGVGDAISREVGRDRISAGPNHHVKGKKVAEAIDLSASQNEKSGSMNSTSNPDAILKSNEVESNQLSEPLQLSVGC